MVYFLVVTLAGAQVCLCVRNKYTT